MSTMPGFIVTISSIFQEKAQNIMTRHVTFMNVHLNVTCFLCVETAETSGTLDGEVRQGRRTETKRTGHPESIEGQGPRETSIPDEAGMYGRHIQRHSFVFNH